MSFNKHQHLFSISTRFSATKRGRGDSGSFTFMVDGHIRASKDANYGSDYQYPSGSATINLKVKAGQIAQIQNIGSDEIFGAYRLTSMDSWFTGHLLYAL